MTPDAPARTKVFISYSHKDEEWLDRLRVHLKPVERSHGIDVWHDKKITPGMSWHDEITQALGSAKVAVLLVTADFLASEFIDREEIPPLLEAARAGGAVILPIIVNHSRFSDIESLSRYQSANDPNKPLAGLSKVDSDKILADVSRIVEQILTGGAPGHGSAPSALAAGPAALPQGDPEPEADEETASLAHALALDIEQLLDDESIEGLVLFEAGEDDAEEPVDLMVLGVNEAGLFTCEVVANDQLPEEMQLSPRAQKRLVDEFGFNPPEEDGGVFWQEIDLDDVDLQVVAQDLVHLLESVYDVSEDRIAWRSLPD